MLVARNIPGLDPIDLVLTHSWKWKLREAETDFEAFPLAESLEDKVYLEAEEMWLLLASGSVS